jgi:hypothetical protein
VCRDGLARTMSERSRDCDATRCRGCYTQLAPGDPVTFMALLGRVLPLVVKQDGREPVVPVSVTHVHIHD